ncbi:MAG: CapA family protein [Gammaproteobacteria bacterium]
MIKHVAQPIAILALLAAAGCATAPVEVSEDARPEPAEIVASTPAAPVPDYAAMRITVAATGDIMLGTDYPENHLPDDDGVSFLDAVAPLLQSADVSFGNLEGVLQDGGEPVKECNNPKACYLFRSPTRYANHLAAAGFDVMSIANNHARDFGEAGRDSTMTVLDRAGIRHSGRQGSIASWRQDELQIAMIAFSPTRGSWPLLETEAAVATVRDLAHQHEIVIVSFHGGAEGFDGAERLGFGMEFAYGEPRGDVVKFSRAMIDAGADLVLGHGPHVPRAMELYKDRLIAYSLGNFATYYGISVAGVKGYAPVLVTELDGNGRFMNGRVHSNIQVRPGGPQPDPRQRALNMIRELTEADFPEGKLMFSADGRLSSR